MAVSLPDLPRVLLGAWRSTWLAYELERASGRYTRRLVRLGEVLPVSGFGAVERTREQGKLFFALYRFGGRMQFQAGAQHFDLDQPGLGASYQRAADRRSSEFTLARGDEILFRCSYSHPLRALFTRRPEPGDSVDLETDHFLAHVAGLRLPLTDLGEWVDAERASPAYRRALREQLALLGDLDQQRAYAAEVKIADVPSELVCGWFDDVYIPDSPAFASAFSPAELDLLARFSALFETAMREMGEVKDLPDLQSRPAWVCVAEEAVRLFGKLPEAREG